MPNVDAIVTHGGALLARFEDAERASAAVRRLEARGFGLLESCSPVPLTREDGQQAGQWLSMGLIAAAAAVVGAVIAYVLQWYVNARSYVLNIGGRPPHAVPAFWVATFETTVLFAAIACFVGVLVALRLPRLWRPVYEIEGMERAPLDAYWIAVGLGSGGADIIRTRQELIEMGAVRVIHAATES